MIKKVSLTLAVVLCLFIGACSDSTNKTAQEQAAPASMVKQQVSTSRTDTEKKPVAQIETVKPQETIQEIVYITRTGSKYHRAGCQHLRRSAIQIELSQAKIRYSPCSRCNPPQ